MDMGSTMGMEFTMDMGSTMGVGSTRGKVSTMVYKLCANEKLLNYTQSKFGKSLLKNQEKKGHLWTGR